MRRLCFLALMIVAGCAGNKTETGREYKPLNDSPGIVRGYYAPAFTAASQAGINERREQLDARKPTAGRR